MARQLPSFAVIGLLSTAAQLALYLMLRLFLPSLAANGLSLLMTTVANTAANRRYTFGVKGPGGAMRHQLEGGLTFLIGLALSTASLLALHALAPGSSKIFELGTVVAANALATLVRFLLMRSWVFHPRRVNLDLEGSK